MELNRCPNWPRYFPALTVYALHYFKIFGKELNLIFVNNLTYFGGSLNCFKKMNFKKALILIIYPQDELACHLNPTHPTGMPVHLSS